jgi:hypothetical protein
MTTDDTPDTAVRETIPTAPAVFQIRRGDRVIGVVLADEHGCRWQRTGDPDRLVTIATVTAGAVATAAVVAGAFGRPPVQRITMGPGGWVSFRGTRSPRLRGPRRPWWARALGARPLDR